jgi:hypothetical protein
MANDRRDRILRDFSRIVPWLLIALAALLARVYIRAERQSDWFLAQGAFIGILFLLAVAGVILWREHRGDLKRVLDSPLQLAGLAQSEASSAVLAFEVRGFSANASEKPQTATTAVCATRATPAGPREKSP